MLYEPNCCKRQCRWFAGIMTLDGTEATETAYCRAFPDGIPKEIQFGNDKHDTKFKGQRGDTVYEKDTDWEHHWDTLPDEDMNGEFNDTPEPKKKKRAPKK